MLKIRHSVFETNSSSTHSVTLFSEESWEKFCNGEIGITRYSGIVEVDDLKAAQAEAKQKILDYFKENDIDEEDWEYFDDDMIYTKEEFEARERSEICSLKHKVDGKVIWSYCVFGYDG